MSLGRDCLDAVRVPDDQVGVGAHGDAPLPRVQVEDFGGVCAGHSHKLVLIHLASHLGGQQRSHCTSQQRAGTTARFPKISTGVKKPSGRSTMRK